MIRIRQIAEKDNATIASIIRNALQEHGADLPGTVFFDSTTDHLYELFQQANAAYFVAELEGELVGGCGIFPTHSLPSRCTELVKLYISPTARGKGVAQQLIQICIDTALQKGYDSLYLESLPQLSKAVSLYQKMGFEPLEVALGESGHFACSIWMLKKLV